MAHVHTGVAGGVQGVTDDGDLVAVLGVVHVEVHHHHQHQHNDPAAVDAENLRLTRQTADGDARRRELQTKIDGQEDLARQLRQQAQNCLAGQSELQTKTGGISDRIARRKEQQAALAAERQGAESRLADLRQLMTDLDGDCRSREDLARQLHESQVRAREQMAEHQTRCDSLHRQAEDLRGQLQTLQREKLDLEQQRTALNRQTQTCNDAVIAAQQELSRLEQKRSAAAMEEKTILDKLWERYELSHSEAQAQRVELESIPKATRRIGELNRSIKALGTPNIGAIEEYERVNGRYTYLSDQRADVEKAKGELTGVIDQLTQQMTEIFAQQFRLLNDSFQETFLELFGGGKARLELEDEKDILNCGIEIKVQPPGKQLKTITLLSGGEKAFVAIALYFAILKVHPTPFCVMDEIEAALDAGKHVFSEKPLGVTMEQCLQAEAAVARHPELVCMLGFMRRYDKSYAYAKEKIAAGAIGTPYLVKSTGIDPEAVVEGAIRYSGTSGGIFLDSAIHDMDLMRWFLGSEAAEVYAMGCTFKHPAFQDAGDDETGVAVYKFKNGAMGMVHVGRTAPYGYHIETEIVGTEGTIRISAVPEKNRAMVYDVNGARTECVESFPERFAEAYLTEMEEFVRCVREGRKPDTGVADGIYATRVGYATTEAWKTGKIVKI